MDAVFDYGNTFIKLGWFRGNALQETIRFASEEEALRHLNTRRPTRSIMSSVSHGGQAVREWLEAEGLPCLEMAANIPLPIAVDYKTPHTLGVDRIAGVTGAWQRHPGEACLVIDAGTSITYDFIDASGTYRGGGISLGMAMRFRALHAQTARLPLVEFQPEVALVGQSTEECIRSGVVQGTLAEVEGIIYAYTQMHEHLRVLVCGGDADFFESNLKHPIFAVRELVLLGLNSILQYNAGENF